MNPIINQMMGNMFANNPFVRLYKMVQGAQNKTEALQTAASSNPQLSQVLNFISNNGNNAKELYYNACKQQNKDPNIIINQLKNL